MDRVWKYLIFIMVWMLFGAAIIFGQVLPLMLPLADPPTGAMSLFLACLCWWFIGSISFSVAEGTF